jgi:hypothetical protein
MMALANLLAHPGVGAIRIASGPMEGVLRSAKDLGRTIALAYLASREETEKWPTLWRKALETAFPSQWQELARQTGSGLKELLEDKSALEDARKTTEVGLLNGMNISTNNLKAIGKRFLVDAIDPLFESIDRRG